MSLDWNFEKVKNYKKLCWDPALEQDGSPIVDAEGDPLFKTHYVTESLIFLTMNVGIPRITEETYEEFHRRALAHAEAFGLPIYETRNGVRRERTVTLAEVKAHIGLKTNARRKRQRVFDRGIEKELANQEPIFADDVTDEEKSGAPDNSMSLRV